MTQTDEVIKRLLTEAESQNHWAQLQLAALQKQNQHLSNIAAVLIVGLACTVLLLLLLVLGSAA